MINNRVTKLFGIEFPLIQAGMIWCSGWELASAVSNAGGLGIIGAGSMYPEVLKIQIKKCFLFLLKTFSREKTNISECSTQPSTTPPTDISATPPCWPA